MNDRQRLIGKKLDHLRRMREYLNFSLQRVRNAINHEYEEGSARLSGFFLELTRRVPTLLDYHDRAEGFCSTNYPHPSP